MNMNLVMTVDTKHINPILVPARMAHTSAQTGAEEPSSHYGLNTSTDHLAFYEFPYQPKLKPRS